MKKVRKETRSSKEKKYSLAATKLVYIINSFKYLNNKKSSKYHTGEMLQE